MKKNNLTKKIVIAAASVLVLTVSACAKKADMNDMKASESMSMEKSMDPAESMKSGDGMSSSKDMNSEKDMKSGDSMSSKGSMKNDMKDGGMMTASVSPDISLRDFDGNQVSLDNYKNKRLYIKYWASWCSVCLAGLEDLNTLAGEDRDYEIITVVSPGMKGEKSEEDFKKWFSSLGYDNIKVLFDTDGSLAARYNVIAYPTSIYIEKEASSSKVQIGHNDNATINGIMSEETF